MRWTRSILAVVLSAVAGLAVTAAPAIGGGSWLHPDQRTYVPGDRAFLRGSFSSGSLEGRISDGPYVAYLLPQGRWIEGSGIPESAIWLGELRFGRSEGTHLRRARIEFTVPEVVRGFYHVSYCNAPCTVDGIGDLIGSSSFAVAPTLAEGRLMVRVAHLESRIRVVRQRVHAKARSEHNRLERALEESTSDLVGVRERVAALETQLAALRESPGPETRLARPFVDPWVGLAVAVGLAALALALMIRRRWARGNVSLVMDASLDAPLLLPRVKEDAHPRS